LQPSSFFEDVEKLKEVVDGEAMRFGKIHSHHNLIFNLKRKYTPESTDTTTELLMYDFKKEVSHFFTHKADSKEKVRNFMQLDKIMPGFEIDDYLFSPFGYSLNALRGEDYYTIHITPQEDSPYVSFETNLNMEAQRSKILNHFLEIFVPASFDIITFNTSNDFDVKGVYSRSAQCNHKLVCGYDVEFDTFHKNEEQIESPYFFNKDS